MKRVILFYLIYLIVGVCLSSCEVEEDFEEHNTCDRSFDNGENSTWIRNEIRDFNGSYSNTSSLSSDNLIRIAILLDYHAEPYYLFHEQSFESGSHQFIFHLYDCHGGFIGKARNSDANDSFNNAEVIEVLSEHGTGNYNIWPEAIEQ